MVLSTNFYKIARNALRTRIRNLSKWEKKDLYETILRKKIFFNIIFCILVGWIGVIGILFLFISVLN